jgi:glutaminase
VSNESTISPPVQTILNELHQRYAPLTQGSVATYIPELSRADPEKFGIAVVTLDGHVYTVGDSDLPFTIQSISKPFVYGLALEDHGFDHVLDHVGVEPTGDAFNAISLDPDTGRPANPMINAGAIATTSLVVDKGGVPAMERILDMFSRYAGRKLEIDQSVYVSERDTGHRNRAISHMLRNFLIVRGDPEKGLDRYFRQCSISVTCRDLAIMGATLANRGINPVTGERAIRADYVDSVLSIMGSCGMYNYAGEWIYRVGMPAKSGVAGGLLSCLAGQLGIGVYSPRLDDRGNTVRGVHVCDDLSHLYKLHIHNAPNVSRASIRSRYNATEVHSKRHRTPRETDILLKEGGRVRIYELQGHLNFASVESFSRDMVEQAGEADFLAVDFKRALRMDQGGIALFEALLETLLAAGKQIAVADAEHVAGLGDRVEAMSQKDEGIYLAENIDWAIEWCEDQLIAAVDPDATPETEVPLHENEFFSTLDSTTVEKLIALARPDSARAGEVLIQAGDLTTTLFFLTRGEVSVTIDLPYQEHVRIATHSAGMAFGHLAVLETRPEAADYNADTDIEYYTLAVSDIEAVAESDPLLMVAVYKSVGLNIAGQLLAATTEIQALST